MGGWYIGYKFHLITNSLGVYRDLLVTSASVHDSYFLKVLNAESKHLNGEELLEDRS